MGWRKNQLSWNCLDDYEFGRSWDDLIELETPFGQQLTVFLGGALFSTCQHQHDEISQLPCRWEVCHPSRELRFS